MSKITVVVCDACHNGPHDYPNGEMSDMQSGVKLTISGSKTVDDNPFGAFGAGVSVTGMRDIKFDLDMCRGCLNRFKTQPREEIQDDLFNLLDAIAEEYEISYFKFENQNIFVERSLSNGVFEGGKKMVKNVELETKIAEKQKELDALISQRWTNEKEAEKRFKTCLPNGTTIEIDSGKRMKASVHVRNMGAVVTKMAETGLTFTAETFDDFVKKNGKEVRQRMALITTSDYALGEDYELVDPVQ
jgi:hypothetical protein